MSKYFQGKDSTFCQVIFLEQTSENIFNQLRKDNYLKDYTYESKKEFTEKISYYMCELIALHPFLELNGRTIRLFFDMICTYNGYDYIDYQDTLNVKRGENKFIKASMNCMTGDTKLIKRIIYNGLHKAE